MFLFVLFHVVGLLFHVVGVLIQTQAFIIDFYLMHFKIIKINLLTNGLCTLVVQNYLYIFGIIFFYK